jgi:tetratricopeptide (TPR) repeat protein
MIPLNRTDNVRRIPTMASLIALLLLLASARSFSQTNPEQKRAIQMHATRARQALEEKKPDLAVREFQAILALDPENVEARGNLGVVAFVQGKYAEASQHFRQALVLKPSLWKVQAMLGLCEKNLGETASAQARMRQAFPHLHDVKLQTLVGMSLVEFSYQKGDMEAALAPLRALQQSDPTNVDVSYATYRIYSDLAAQARDRIALLGPDSARMHQVLAQHFVNEGNIKAAIEQYREALHIDPRLSGAHFELGEAILQDSLNMESQENARKEFEAALEQNSIDEKSECWLGTIAFLEGNSNEAFRRYTHALEVNPYDATAQLGIAKVQISLGQKDQALEHLREAIRIDPTSSSAHYRLSQLYRQMDRTADSDREAAIFKSLRESQDRVRAQFYKAHADSKILDSEIPQ